MARKPHCPRCRIPLHRQKTQGVQYDFCVQCFGAAIPVGNLARLIKRSHLTHLWQQANQSPADGLPCPHCQRPHRRVACYESLVELDFCVDCHSVWLEAGEAQHLKNSGPKSFTDFHQHYGRLVLKFSEDIEDAKTSFLIHVIHPWNLEIKQILLTSLGLIAEQKRSWLQEKPLLTWILMAAITILSLWGFQDLELASQRFGFSAHEPFPSQLLHALTSFFIHGNALHMLLNLYVFWLFSRSVEDHLGKLRFAVLLVVGQIFSSFVFAVMDPSSQFPLIGASGGLCAIIAYDLTKFPKRKFVIAWRFIIPLRFISIPGALLGALYFFYEIMGLATSSAVGGNRIAHSAHLAGALVGVLFAWIVLPDGPLRLERRRGQTNTEFRN